MRLSGPRSTPPWEGVGARGREVEGTARRERGVEVDIRSGCGGGWVKLELRGRGGVLGDIQKAAVGAGGSLAGVRQEVPVSGAGGHGFEARACRWRVVLVDGQYGTLTTHARYGQVRGELSGAGLG